MPHRCHGGVDAYLSLLTKDPYDDEEEHVLVTSILNSIKVTGILK
jgi:hypothetical protein